MSSPAANDQAPSSWSRAVRKAAAAGWASFLAACLGALVGFAAVDPQWIIDGVAGAAHRPAWLTRTGVYTLAFFLFWAIGACAALLAAYLVPDEP